MTDPIGKIVTFYSYKGGTGRSMALANVAWILASNGKRVLSVDWDLEAPGLHRYFHPFLADKDVSHTGGIIDMVTEYADAAMEPTASGEVTSTDSSPYADIRRYAESLDWDFRDGGSIDFVPAGRQGPNYATRVNSFDWSAFYARLGGQSFIDAVKASMRSEYDYILIDSRTGVSDTSGICTIHLPDQIVVCFTLNTQSIYGAAAVTRSIFSRLGQRGLQVLLVKTRVDKFEKERLDRMRELAATEFASILDSRARELGQTDQMEVEYIPYYAYEEVLAPFADKPDDDGATMLQAMEKLTSAISDGQTDKLLPTNELARADLFVRSRQARVYDIDEHLRWYPETRELVDEIRVRYEQWLEGSHGDLLPLELVRKLHAAPELLAAFAAFEDFRRFRVESFRQARNRATVQSWGVRAYLTLWLFLGSGVMTRLRASSGDTLFDAEAWGGTAWIALGAAAGAIGGFVDGARRNLERGELDAGYRALWTPVTGALLGMIIGLASWPIPSKGWFLVVVLAFLTGLFVNRTSLRPRARPHDRRST